MDSQNTSLERDDVLDTSKNSYSLSPSTHPSSLRTSRLQSSPSSKSYRDSDIPYRSGWVRKFKQSTETHSYLPPLDSNALFSSLAEKKSIQKTMINPATKTPNHTLKSSHGDDNKEISSDVIVNKSTSSSKLELEQKIDMNATDTSPDAHIGAARSPWAKEILKDEESDNNDDQRSGSYLSLLEMNDLLSTPNSSGYVSSLTNRSSKSFDSIRKSNQFDAISSQSPTLHHLEYLAAHSTTALAPKFLPEPNYTKNQNRFHNFVSISEDSGGLSLLQLKNIYGCHSRRDAMKLALDQSNALSKASDDLIDLLFEYLNKCCGVEARQLFQHHRQEEHEHIQESTFSQKGLSLPASAIGWLSAYLYPSGADKNYQQQWFDASSDRERSCLPNASPGPRMQNKFSLLRTLLSNNVTHLRITGVAWPGNVKRKRSRNRESIDTTNNTPRRRGRMLLNFDSRTTSSFLAFYRHLQNNPRLDMRLFPNVQYLHLEGVPGEWLSNLNVTRPCLQRLLVKRGHIRNISNFFDMEQVIQSNIPKDDGSIDATNHFHTPQKVGSSLDHEITAAPALLEMQQPVTFSKLTHLSLSYCGIGELSDLGRHTRKNLFWSPLSSLSSLKTLDLSHNELCDPGSALQGLDHLPMLSGIDLSFNRIQTMNGAHLLLGNIKVLLLSHNLITNVEGLDRLFPLQKLDVSYNKISKLADISSIGKLPDLMDLRLIGNPFCFIGKQQSRCKLFNIFKDARMKDDSQLTYRSLKNILPRIDGTQISNKELVTLRLLTFAQMLDVENDFRVDGAINIKHVANPKEKNVVVIHDINQNITRELSKDAKLRKVSSVSLKRDPARVIPYRSPLPVISESNVSIEEVVKYVHPVVENAIQIESFNSDVDINGADTSDSFYSSSDDDQSHSEEEEEDDDDYKDNLHTSSHQCDTEVDESSREPANEDIALDASSVEDNHIVNNALNGNVEPTSLDDDINSIAEDISIIKKEKSTEHFERYDFANLERSAEYDGPDTYSDLIVANCYELYFRSYVFPSQQHSESIDLYEENIREKMLPRIQLYQSDRDLMILSLTHTPCRSELPSVVSGPMNECFVSISKEELLACGMAATGRIAPTEVEIHGFRGNKLLDTSGNPHTFSISKTLMLCVSTMALYIIPNFSDGDLMVPRKFPSSISTAAKFKDAAWPHAYCRHPFKFLRKISFDGYGFQRLTLHFRLPALHGEVLIQPDDSVMSNFDYSYVIFTCKQKRTIELMQVIQQAAKEALPNESVDLLSEPSSIIIGNDDDLMVKAVSRALNRPKFCDDILHYQILYQLWPDKASVRARRSLVLTNDEIFLFHETYAGDCSACAPETNSMMYGDLSMRTIASIKLHDIDTIGFSRESPRQVNIDIKPQSRLRKSTNWSDRKSVV